MLMMKMNASSFHHSLMYKLRPASILLFNLMWAVCQDNLAEAILEEKDESIDYVVIKTVEHTSVVQIHWFDTTRAN